MRTVIGVYHIVYRSAGNGWDIICGWVSVCKLMSHTPTAIDDVKEGRRGVTLRIAAWVGGRVRLLIGQAGLFFPATSNGEGCM